MDVRSVSPYNVYNRHGSSENVARWTQAKKEGLGKRLLPFPVTWSESVTPGKFLNTGANMGSRIEVCMGVENHSGM